MSENKYGIADTMDMIAFLQSMADKMLLAKNDDGEIKTSEIIAALMTSSPQALSAFVGYDNIDNELADLDHDEQQKVLAASVKVVQTFGKLFIKDHMKLAE